MGQLWTIITHLYAWAGPTIMLIYPLYASIETIETPTKLDDEQWLAYWILYSFLTLLEMALQRILYWVPIWYDIKLVVVAWLVLPYFRGAAYVYDKVVREKLLKIGENKTSRKVLSSPKSKSSSPKNKEKDKGNIKRKFVSFVTNKKKGEQEAY